jgi:hypothetical protein
MRFISENAMLQLALGWLLVCLVGGCGSNKTETDFVPPDDVVEKALETALRAWQDGKTPGALQGSSPPIQVVDAQWQSGQKLKSFEILGEDEAEGAPRWLSVKLTLDSGKEETVHYVLVGKESIWIYRDEDFARATGMQANPPLKPKTKTPRAK